jgi:hypothetical protein
MERQVACTRTLVVAAREVAALAEEVWGWAGGWAAAGEGAERGVKAQDCRQGILPADAMPWIACCMKWFRHMCAAGNRTRHGWNLRASSCHEKQSLAWAAAGWAAAARVAVEKGSEGGWAAEERVAAALVEVCVGDGCGSDWDLGSSLPAVVKSLVKLRCI